MCYMGAKGKEEKKFKKLEWEGHTVKITDASPLDQDGPRWIIIDPEEFFKEKRNNVPL